MSSREKGIFVYTAGHDKDQKTDCFSVVCTKIVISDLYCNEMINYKYAFTSRPCCIIHYVDFLHAV